ncbi:arylamine N-acetyltransferase [Mycobacterium uberis]|uniref:arylamine N-acetyltransferase n=1 Tax=Mycobacterium uberis TaxID=2162698 RepID=UPI001FB224BC|nr:arylamine N-acetyltransferase [Mycobacterium uberis]
MSRRGGYCYAHNELLGYVLAEIGFQVRRLASRMVGISTPDALLLAQRRTVLVVTFLASRGCT